MARNGAMQAITNLADESRRLGRPRSTLTVGEWTIEARPEGLVVTHGPTGQRTQLAATPQEGE